MSTRPPTSRAPAPGGTPAGAADPTPVRAFCERHGLPGLADVHTHFLPPQVLAKVWAVFDRIGDDGAHAPWPITYRLDEADRVATLRALGVRRFTALVYAHRPGMAEWLNGWAADFAARTPDCAHSATFYPEEGAATYVARAIAAGARICKLHLRVGDVDPLDPMLDPVWGLLAEAGVPTVVHCGSGPFGGRFTGPDRMAALLAAHPRLPLVIAHAGMPEYADFLELVERHPHVWLDTTMVFTDYIEATMPYPRDLLPRLADRGDRVVLGSDFPNIPYPYAHQVAALERLDLGSAWLRRVCWDNGIALVGGARS